MTLVTCMAVGLGTVTAGPVVATPDVLADATDGAVLLSAATDDPVKGTVFAVAQVGDLTIIGGDFDTVGGQPRRNLAAIGADGKVDPDFAPNPDGIVYAVAGSADGSRVFLGGSFANAGGQPRQNLAAVDSATGTAITDWKADANGAVRALAVAGSRLYAGGAFTAVGSANRRRLAALDTTSASVFLGFNPWPDWTVRGLAVGPLGNVYAVGAFTSIGGASRPGVAEVSPVDGRATAFSPSDGGTVLAVGLTPDGSRLFVCTASNRLIAYAPQHASSPVWDIKTSGDVQAIAASGTEVYIGGHFAAIARTKRNMIGSVLVANGSTTEWAPALTGTYMGVWAMATTPDKLLVGGDFKWVAGRSQPRFARFSGTP